jgi:hypothetical protein
VVPLVRSAITFMAALGGQPQPYCGLAGPPQR